MLNEDNGGFGAAMMSAMESSTQETGQASAEQAPAQSTETSQTQAAQPIGFDPEPAKADTTPAWELKVDPQAVIAVVDGKPITAQDVQSGHLMQSDYTRKTQELAEQRAQLGEAATWYEQAQPVLEALASDDINVRRETIMALAKEVGVDLRVRDASGKFAAAQDATEPAIDLSQFEEGSEAWLLAKTVLDQQSALAEIRNAEARRASEAQAAQVRAQVDGIAADWSSKGLTTADTKAALALVGQTITPEQAMWLANREALLRHTASLGHSQGVVVGRAPTEPGAGASVQQATIEEGISFGDAVRRAFAGR